jgi:hypothetical protein
MIPRYPENTPGSLDVWQCGNEAPLLVPSLALAMRGVCACRCIRAREPRSSDDDDLRPRAPERAARPRGPGGGGRRWWVGWWRVRLQLVALRLACAIGALALATTLRQARAQPSGDPQSSTTPSPPATATGNSHEASLTEHLSAQYGQYVDTDHVFVETPSITGTVSDPTAGWSVGGQYLVDVVSAASVDIVSTASRRWQEVRQQGSLEASFRPKTFGVDASGTVSDEPDYVSWSAGGAVTQDLLNKNVTWLLGYAHGHDIAGRTGTAFSVFSHVIDRNAFNAALTLVVSPTTVASLIGDVILESGDQSKPYRYIPLFASGTNVPRGLPINLVNNLRVSARPLEQLPLSRQRYGLTMRGAHRYHLATLRLDERLYLDSWAMKATTTDGRYLFDLSGRVELGPHARLHAQTAVNFWQRAYLFGPGFEYPALRTGDRELGPLVNVTGGWTLRIGLGADANPNSWVLGFDVNATWTQYLDDLYLTRRISALGGVTLETDL